MLTLKTEIQTASIGRKCHFRDSPGLTGRRDAEVPKAERGSDKSSLVPLEFRAFIGL